MQSRGRAEACERFRELVEIVERLRGEGGCPWDREQTHQTLKRCLLEEAYEVIDAIDNGDADRLRDELGDLLMLTVLHAQIATEEGTFTIADVLRSINEKLVRRHPHVFGDGVAKNAKEVLIRWESIKNEDTGYATLAEKIDDIPRVLPALVRAAKVQKAAATVGFDWASPEEAMHKVAEETRETSEVLAKGDNGRLAEEIGDLLFAIVNVARLSGIDAEDTLRRATDKFARRFAELERRATNGGRSLSSLSLTEMDNIWDAVKVDESR